MGCEVTNGNKKKEHIEKGVFLRLGVVTGSAYLVTYGKCLFVLGWWGLGKTSAFVLFAHEQTGNLGLSRSWSNFA